MNITLLSVDIKTQPTKNGKSYQVADVAYKNNTFQGKVEGKKVMSFGATTEAFKTLAVASPGESYTVEVVKNAAGYNDWVSMVKGEANAAPAAAATTKTPTAAPKSNYETSEERALRQVYIIRQSSLTNAISTLSVGSKTAPDPDAVINLASRYFNFVIDGGLAPVKTTVDGITSIEDMPSDFPVAN
jgi:hypothetical protein